MGIYQDNKDAMEFFRNSKQLESNGKWQEFVEQSELEAAVHEPRNMELAKANPWDYTSNVNNPGLEQTEVLRPGETLEEWEPNPFLKPHADGGRIGLKPGGIVEPGVEYYGKFTEAEKKANIKTWMDNTGSTLEDYSKLPSSTQSNIRFARITGIKQTPEYGKKKEGAATKQFRNWLNKQDPKILTADSVDDLIKQSKIKTTSTGQRSGLVNAINRIMEEKEFAKFKNIQLGRVYSQENINQLSDDLLKAYAEDDIRLVMDPKHKASISDIRTNRRGSLDKAIKNTGLDEETIFNLLDDREAYVELEYKKATTKGRPVEKGKAKFYKQAENWIVKNSKRYADPDKFKKAFVRTFGKDNHLIQTINKGISRGITRAETSVPFSDWFRSNIMGSSEQAMRGQVKPSYSSTQLDNIFKTAIYTNNENVRNKIINELTDILPEKGSKRIPDIRDKFRNSPILKKFGLNQKIDGPIARLLAKEVGDDLLKQVSLFRRPWLGTPELITYLKDRVNPKYKSMFEEASKAILYAQKKQWPEAKKALNISESIMFDHKIPKALMQLGYADDIEYIKVNPTSAEFNARIKNTQFDKPMIKLANQWEKAKTVDAKSKIVGEMNTLKDTFSKKYGNYLDDVKINVDKTGKPVFSSEAPVVTKKTDLVKSLKASLQQERKGITSPPKNIKGANQAGFVSKELLEDTAKGLGKGAKTIGSVARKLGAGYELGFIGLDFINNLDSMDADTAFKTALENATLGMYGGGKRAQWEDFETAGKELGHNPENLNEIKSMLDLEKMLAGEKEVLNEMIAYNQTDPKTHFPEEEIKWRKDVVARLKKEFENKQNTFWSKDNAEDLAKNYQDTVGYIARKGYNKNLNREGAGKMFFGDKERRVNPDMNVIGSPLWQAITDWKDYVPQSILPQNFLQNYLTKAIPNTLRKLPGVLGDVWEPTSERAKLYDMSEEEIDQRAKDLNIQEQYYHPVTGNTMTDQQMESYYDRYYSGGGIASLNVKK